MPMFTNTGASLLRRPRVTRPSLPGTIGAAPAVSDSLSQPTADQVLSQPGLEDFGSGLQDNNLRLLKRLGYGGAPFSVGGNQ